MTTEKVDPPNMSVADVAKYLGVTTRTVQQMIHDGRLRAYNLGQRIVRFRQSDVDAALTLIDPKVNR